MQLRDPLVQPLGITAGKIPFAHDGVDPRCAELKQRLEGIARGVRDVPLARGDLPRHLLGVHGMVHKENAGRGIVRKHRAASWSKKAASPPVAFLRFPALNIAHTNREFLDLPEF